MEWDALTIGFIVGVLAGGGAMYLDRLRERRRIEAIVVRLEKLIGIYEKEWPT